MPLWPISNPIKNKFKTKQLLVIQQKAEFPIIGRLCFSVAKKRSFFCLACIITLPSSYLHAEEVTDYSGLIGARDYQEGVVLANDITVPENTQQVYIQYEGNGSLSSKGDNVYTINGNNIQTYIQAIAPEDGGEMNFNLSNIKLTNFASYNQKGVLNISGVNDPVSTLFWIT